MTSSSAEPSAKATPEIKAVVFDYGMVLSGPPDPANWDKIREVSGIEDGALHHGYWIYRHDYDRGVLTGPAYWQAIAADSGTTFTKAQVAALIEGDTVLWTDLNQPMVDWAASLQLAGITTGILSNIGDSIAAGIQAKFSWIANFDHCTWSHATGIAKPEVEIFLLTARALDTPPANILFLDDREDNLQGAQTAGFQTLLYSTQETFEHNMRHRGLEHLLHPEAAPANA